MSELQKGKGRGALTGLSKLRDEGPSYQERVESFNNHPIILKRGRLFRNWWNHASVLGIVSALTCPECGVLAENLVWKCHDMTIQEAVDLAREKYEEAVHDEEDNKILDKFKEEIGWSTRWGGELNE